MTLSKEQKELLSVSIKVALQIGEAGKEFTGTIGELSACLAFSYKWEPSTGFDAIDSSGKKIQIKTRKLWTSTNFSAGRIGRFGRKKQGEIKYLFDAGILVWLDDKFEIKQAWEMERHNIQKLEANEKSDRGLHVSTFITKGTEKHI